MEPTTAATPSAAVTTPAAQTAPTQRPALPHPTMWIALAIAAALPFILLTTLIIVMIAFQYNFLNWME